jgi:hypothetical protein
MRTGGLDRSYDRLTAEERFRLFVAAKARQDGAETERLLRSCPQRVYRLRDPAFGDRIDGARTLTMALVRTLDGVKGQIDAIESSERVGRILFGVAADAVEFEAFRESGELQPAFRQTIRRQRSVFRRILRHRRKALRLEGAVLAHAFAEVCRDELEADPDELVAAIASPYSELFSYFIALRPDQEAIEAAKAEVSGAWRSWVE